MHMFMEIWITVTNVLHLAAIFALFFFIYIIATEVFAIPTLNCIHYINVMFPIHMCYCSTLTICNLLAFFYFLIFVLIATELFVRETSNFI